MDMGRDGPRQSTSIRGNINKARTWHDPLLGQDRHDHILNQDAESKKVRLEAVHISYTVSFYNAFYIIV